MTEKQIEMKLIKETKQGGLALKFISPGFVGMPDRIYFYQAVRWLLLR